MAISAAASDTRVRSVQIDDARLTVDRIDGRSMSVPLGWYHRLFDATPGLLRGAPAPAGSGAV
ncbi:MAG TPA: DUF2442 domain-containing protein [Xanthobacteraceae bacterium]